MNFSMIGYRNPRAEVSNSFSLGGHIGLTVAFKGPNVISTP